VFEANNIKYQWAAYKATCTTPHNEFEIEVCRIQGTQMCGLELRRKKGSLWNYQIVCRSLITQWKL
jgi:hypothetical protein